ncbi:MAG TPA: crosslink repair DNA glycosylase YcaQ family protein, partial [Promineifilum sp.]
TRQGIEAVATEFYSEEVEGQTHWFANDVRPPREPSPTAYVFSIFDEYTIGYKDRSAIGEQEHGQRLQAMGNALQNVIIIDGRIAGTWRRAIQKTTVHVEFSLLRPLTGPEIEAVNAAAARYAKFLDLGLDAVYG